MTLEQRLSILRDELIKEELNLPIEYTAETYPSLLKKKYDNFKKSVYLMKESGIFTSSEVDCIEGTCQTILAALNEYFQGLPASAFDIFKQGTDRLLEYIDKLALYNRRSENRFYRIRYDANLAVTQRKQLFHIPFESRGFVSTQRYSIPGFPSLYLGSSVYACLEELRKMHDTSNLYVSSYKIADDIKFIDFGFPPRVAKDASYKIKDEQECFLALKAYYQCWPLLAACSVRVLEDRHTFKAEYIIPQLLLQWVRSSTDYSGIRYFTSRNYSYVKSVHLYQNYVFPVEQNQEEGYCGKLIENFKLTDPILFDTYRDSYKRDSLTSIYLGIGRKGSVDDGKESDYRCTYYAYLEEELEKMEHANLADYNPIV
ncbi:hypothetical protein [Paenibacillus pabuli]|uniref:hypothetical protein n=1 Tax=Paenibacillus pabuli TaxID=1472 RepID=UPI0007867416|nr:hypothetical protein [Paenibacillus pabuli]MEC0126496.1 hypothetical protein [Paenibacillus pabuli]